MVEKVKKKQLWQKFKIQIETKLKNSNCEKKLSCVKTLKNKLGQNWKTHNVTKHKKTLIVTKLKTSNCD